MKKSFSSVIIFFILVLVLWAVSGWYFGTKTEQEFKEMLQQSSQIVGKRLLRAELLSYKKTASGAKAKLSVSSDYVAINEQLGGLQMNVSLLNGPVFLTRSGISIGSSRWVLSFDKSDRLSDLFSNVLPHATVVIDFDQKAHYVVMGEIDITHFLITGFFDLESQDNRGAIKLANFRLGSLPNMINADDIKISFQHQKAITTRYKPGTASLQISSLKLNHNQLEKPLVLDVKMNSNVTFSNDTLKGFLKAEIRNVNVDQFPLDTGELSLQFNGLPASSFVAYSEANNELNNLHQQVQWTLEELGEVPEGQDQIWALYDRIDESSNTLPKLLAEQVPTDMEELIKLNAVAHYKNASSSFNGNIELEREHPKLNSWLSLLKGEARVELDEGLLSVIQKFLPIVDPDFTLFLKDNKVLMAQ